MPPDGVSRVRRTLTMDELFEIDAQAREQALSQEDRLFLRLEKSKPLLDDTRAQIQTAEAKEAPTVV